MPYSNFSIKKVQRDFAIQIVEAMGLFAGISPYEISGFLKESFSLVPKLRLGMWPWQLKLPKIR